MEWTNAFRRENLPYVPLAAYGLAKGVWEVYGKEHLSAKKAWGAITAMVVAYEIVAPEGELLSEGVDRALNKHPLLTRAAIGVTALHLMNLLPESIDPYHQITERLRGRHE